MPHCLFACLCVCVCVFVDHRMCQCAVIDVIINGAPGESVFPIWDMSPHGLLFGWRIFAL